MAQASWPRDARDEGPFDGQLKCCTYLPFLPNFTLGRLLKEGLYEVALAEAAKRGELTPLGLLPRAKLADVENFGRDPSARCPFLVRDLLRTEKTACQIWRNRPSVCRSYFCISNEGHMGQAKWKEAEEMGNELEWTLANQILWEMGFTDDDISSKSWMEWGGREGEFYLKCADLSETLSPED